MGNCGGAFLWRSSVCLVLRVAVVWIYIVTWQRKPFRTLISHVMLKPFQFKVQWNRLGVQGQGAVQLDIEAWA